MTGAGGTFDSSRLSVVIPARNEERRIAATVRAVLAQRPEGA